MSRTPVTDAVDKALESLVSDLVELSGATDDRIDAIVDRLENVMPHQLLYDICSEALGQMGPTDSGHYPGDCFHVVNDPDAGRNAI